MIQKQSFWKGSAVLLLSAILAKGLGACFKIPLTNALGGTGMGYFSCAYGLLLPVYALSVTGISAAVAQTVSLAAALGHWNEVRRIRKIARLVCALAGLLLTGLMLLLAQPFTLHIASQPHALLSVLAIAPAACFGCLTAAERGYWEGLQTMTPTAVSQAVEAVFKLGLGLFLCQWVLQHPEKICHYVSPEIPLSALASAAAVLGVTLSVLLGWLYFCLYNLRHRRQIPRSTEAPAAASVLLRRLLYVMVPVALGSLVTNLTSLLDLVTMLRCLGLAQLRHPEALVQRLGKIASEPDFPAFVYGSFTGMAITVFNLVPSVTNMLGKSALPCAAACWARKDTAAAMAHCRSVVTAAAAMAFPAAGGLWVLAEPVMHTLYRSRPEEAVLAAMALRALLPGMVCLCLTFPLCSVLQGIGRAMQPVQYMLAGVAVKLLGNLLLIPQPAFCITGAGISTSLCYLLLLILVLWDLRRVFGSALRLFRPLLPILLGTAGCMSAAYGCKIWLCHTSSFTVTAVCTLAGGCVYFLVFFLSGKNGAFPVKKANWRCVSGRVSKN